MPNYNLQRFLDAQQSDYEQALTEVGNGRKYSHWIWYIFPQLKGLGMSYNSQYYGLSGKEEAEAYLAHPILGERLREITSVFLHLKNYPNTSSLLKIADTFTNTFAFYSKKCYSPFPVSLFIIVSYLKQYNVVSVHRLIKSV